MLVFLLIIFALFIFTIERKANRDFKPSLEKDGFVTLDTPTKKQVLQKLPPGYQFLDYVYIIEGCTLSTFHRDVTSSQYVFKTKYPVYTFISYEHDGSTLAVCPGSHATTPLLASRPIVLDAKAVLFNCDLVHSGALNPDMKPRRAIQYKIAHREDVEKLKHLRGIRKVKRGACEPRTFVDTFYRKMSLTFSYVINHHLTPYLQNRKNNIVCKILGEDRCFYNA